MNIHSTTSLLIIISSPVFIWFWCFQLLHHHAELVSLSFEWFVVFQSLQSSAVPLSIVDAERGQQLEHLLLHLTVVGVQCWKILNLYFNLNDYFYCYLQQAWLCSPCSPQYSPVQFLNPSSSLGFDCSWSFKILMVESFFSLHNWSFLKHQFTVTSHHHLFVSFLHLGLWQPLDLCWSLTLASWLIGHTGTINIT